MKILFLGRGSVAATLLEWTAKQLDVQIVGVVGDEELEKCSIENNYPFFTMEEVNAKAEQDHSWVELVISLLYWRILKAPLINIPRYGCINFHPAPLPDYKGRAGCSFAILDKLSEWGCTAHYIDEGIDTGDIIEVARFPFDWHVETGASLKKKTFEVQSNLYKKIISKAVMEGRLKCTPQDKKSGRYISTKDMLAAMEITEEDKDIDAKVQAFWFPPYEGAYIRIPGKGKYTLVNQTILNQLGEASF